VYNSIKIKYFFKLLKIYYIIFYIIYNNKYK
jgi:hypothetical protein